MSTPRAGPSHDSSSRQAYSPEVMPSLGSAARTQKLCLADYPDSSKRSHATSPSPDRRNASGPSSAQTRKAPDQPRRLGKRDNIDHISTDELRDLTGSVYCRVPECPKKRASAAHGLCRDHRHKIADAFQGFYVATQNVVERLAIWDIKPLPEAQINNPFIRHCDHLSTTWCRIGSSLKKLCTTLKLEKPSASTKKARGNHEAQNHGCRGDGPGVSRYTNKYFIISALEM